jgi:glycosyltransferase involved in cell wall biosynthesis
MQKVLYIFGGEKASGAEIVIDRLMRFNAKQVEAHLFISPGNYADNLLGEKPYLITVSNYLKKLNRANTSAIKFLITALQNYLLLSLSVLKYIRKHRIDAVHANTVVPASYIVPAIIIAKLFYPKIKWLWSDHDLTYFSKKDNLFADINLRFYHQTLVVSQAVRLKYSTSRYINKVQVLYNGLDTEKFKPNELLRQQFRALHDISDSKLVFGIAGILSERKGQLSLVKAFIEQARHTPNLYLLVAGSTVLEEKSYAEEVLPLINSSPDKMKYLGPVSDMIAFYNGCDVIINNSNIAGSEPLGTTIYEAMACEKIVMASDTGGTKEIVDNLINGLLFKAENKRELSNSLFYNIQNRGGLNHIRKAARHRAINKFNVAVMAKHYNNLIAQIN